MMPYRREGKRRGNLEGCQTEGCRRHGQVIIGQHYQDARVAEFGPQFQPTRQLWSDDARHARFQRRKRQGRVSLEQL